MHKIDSYGATLGGEFTDGDLINGIPATRVWAKWLNSVQRELIAIVQASGATLDMANDHQVADAINNLIAAGIADAGGGGGSGGSPYWADAVANTGNLPTGKPTGSIALVISNFSLYRFDGTNWVLYLNAPSVNTKIANLESALPNKMDASQKGDPNGVAPLIGGLVPSQYMPPIALTRAVGVANQAARLALTAEQGDIAIQADTGRSYVLKENGNPALNADWLELASPGTVQSVNSQTGTVALDSEDIPEAGDSRYFTAARETAVLSAAATAGNAAYEPKFTTLPVARGGTGETTADGVIGSFGGLPVAATMAATGLLPANRKIPVNTLGGAFTGTLPTAAAGTRIRIFDAMETWHTNNFTLTPAAGEVIGSLAANASLICNVRRGWLELTGLGGGRWAMESNASTFYPTGGAGITPTAQTASFTALANTFNEIDAISGNRVMTLPGGTAAHTVGFIDARDALYFNTAADTRYIDVQAPAGFSIQGYAEGDQVRFDAKGDWAYFTLAAGSMVYRMHTKASTSAPPASSTTHGTVMGGQVPGAIEAIQPGFAGERKSIFLSAGVTGTSANVWASIGGTLTLEAGVWDVGYDVTVLVNGAIGNVGLWVFGAPHAEMHAILYGSSPVSRRTRIVVQPGQTTIAQVAIRSSAATANSVMIPNAAGNTGSISSPNNSQMLWAERK